MSIESRHENYGSNREGDGDTDGPARCRVETDLHLAGRAEMMAATLLMLVLSRCFLYGSRKKMRKPEHRARFRHRIRQRIETPKLVTKRWLIQSSLTRL